MTNELWAALIGGVVLVQTNTAAAIKLWTDVQKQKADRAETKIARDKDSQELHDKVLSHGFQIQQLKDAQSLTATVVDDLRDICFSDSLGSSTWATAINNQRRPHLY